MTALGKMEFKLPVQHTVRCYNVALCSTSSSSYIS